MSNRPPPPPLPNNMEMEMDMNMNMNSMGLNNNSLYYTNPEDLPASGSIGVGGVGVGGVGVGVGMSTLAAPQGAPNGHDTSMTGMLEDGLLDSFDGLPVEGMTLDVNTLDGSAAQNPYASHNPASAMSRCSPDEMEPQDENDVENEQNKQDQLSADKQLGVAGAGPLPTGFGVQSAIGGGSTLTEFTKRRNWSQRVVEELKDFLHILTPDGRIVYLSPSGTPLTGFASDELVGKFIVDYIHPDDSGIFVREFNESIASGNPLRFFYRFRKKDGTYTIFESHGHPHLTSEAATFGPASAAGFCKGFFMMARPYPTKNAALLDSFLEHKIENARLTKRIEDLKREEQEELEGSQQSWSKRDGQTENQSEETDTAAGTSVTSMPLHSSNPDARAMPPPAKPGLNIALTRQNLEDANASNKADSIGDKMARYEGATHIETIEMLTGLRYQDGERSQGISTGDQSPALIRGDAGIAIAADKEARANDKRKKIKLPDEYVCTDCGTLDSPEWRKGPSGPKTLCNACGLRWAKKEKKGKPNAQPPGPPTMGATNGNG
ncbi:hypothetical protein HYFRA_00010984 [Hymenoscyphus fraxineus]|uniref:White collar-2 n=1 Tax=Hymenoscyphus fraxineus TaxID=746836 RepID=A0A9N9PUK3_9HELO|nr:hypothetical protein HYFRA_00010984 [Hymenoscyphus fraxineus]